MLLAIFHDLVGTGRVRAVMDEIILQSRVEFNYEVLEDDDSDEREQDVI
jgi:hypothetical protein